MKNTNKPWLKKKLKKAIIPWLVLTAAATYWISTINSHAKSSWEKLRSIIDWKLPLSKDQAKIMRECAYDRKWDWNSENRLKDCWGEPGIALSSRALAYYLKDKDPKEAAFLMFSFLSSTNAEIWFSQADKELLWTSIDLNLASSDRLSSIYWYHMLRIWNVKEWINALHNAYKSNSSDVRSHAAYDIVKYWLDNNLTSFEWIPSFEELIDQAVYLAVTNDDIVLFNRLRDRLMSLKSG